MKIKTMIKIDGSSGEGGGQVLRSSLSLSMVTGQPFTIENIRAGRKKPGLMRQHITCVRAAAQICGATVTGDEIGSQFVTFEPDKIRTGDYEFQIGTAGSTVLVAQTILPALMLADGPSTVQFKGGTHTKQAPSYDFFTDSFLPQLRKMGVGVEASLIRRGFYPAGGGQWSMTVDPVRVLEPLDLITRGDLKTLKANAIKAQIYKDITGRELKIAMARLGIEPQYAIEIDDRNTDGPGNSFWIAAEHANVTEIFTCHGELGVSAENVAKRACKDADRYLKRSLAAVGPYLADQLLLPMVLAGKGSFTTLRPSLHTTTNIDTIKSFVDIVISLDEMSDGIWQVKVG